MTSQPGATNTMSGYDEQLLLNPQAAAQPTVQSATSLSLKLKHDSARVNVQVSQPVDILLDSAPRPAPAYDPFHTNEATHWSLPQHIANPAPIDNQFMITSAHMYEAFSERDLPPILFRLEPYTDRVLSYPVPMLYTPDGRPVVTARGVHLRYFQFLPRYISYQVPGWLLETWFRLDYRLENADIVARMELGPGQAEMKYNALNMKRTRVRDSLGVLTWSASRSWPSRGDVGVVGELNPRQIAFNTKMVVDLENNRLLKPSFDNPTCTKDNLRGYLVTNLTLDHFVQDVLGTIPSRRMVGIIMLRVRCQELAVKLGHGNNRDNYKLLSDNDAPVWWNDRRPGGHAPGRTITELEDLSIDYPAMTHSEFMLSAIGTNQGIGVSKRANMRRRLVAQTGLDGQMDMEESEQSETEVNSEGS